MAFWIESGSKYRTRKSQIRNHILFRAMDPDPHKFAFIYIFRSWIRIRMLNADPDPGGKTCQIKTEKMQENRYGNNCKIIKIYKVNFHNLHCFLLLGNLFCILQRQKTLHKVIFFLAGSGSAFFRQLDLDPHSEKTAGSGSAKNEWRSTALILITPMRIQNIDKNSRHSTLLREIRTGMKLFTNFGLITGLKNTSTW